MHIPPSSSTDNEENTLLDGLNANEYDLLLPPRITLVKRKVKKRRLIGIILAILTVFVGIFLVFFVAYTNFRNLKYTIVTYFILLIGAFAFYIVIPLSSVYLIYKIIRNERSQTSHDSTTTDQEHSSSHTINHTTSAERCPSRRYYTRQNLKRIWTNWARWQYFVALIVVVLSNSLDTLADIMEARDQFRNVTTTPFWPQKARAMSRLPSYILNSVLIIYTLTWVLKAYSDFAKESDKIRKWFTGNPNEMKMGIDAIKMYSENVLTKKQNWKEKQKLKNANFFASIYVVCCIVWSFAYAYEVSIEEHTITIGTILNCATHFLSCGSLVTIMWLTNKIIDDMKKTALHKMSFEHQNTTIDLVSFKMFIEHYDPYASLFTKKTNLPEILATILPGLASLILAIIKGDFH